MAEKLNSKNGDILKKYHNVTWFDAAKDTLNDVVQKPSILLVPGGIGATFGENLIDKAIVDPINQNTDLKAAETQAILTNEVRAAAYTLSEGDKAIMAQNAINAAAVREEFKDAAIRALQLKAQNVELNFNQQITNADIEAIKKMQLAVSTVEKQQILNSSASFRESLFSQKTQELEVLKQEALDFIKTKNLSNADLNAENQKIITDWNIVVAKLKVKADESLLQLTNFANKANSPQTVAVGTDTYIAATNPKNYTTAYIIIGISVFVLGAIGFLAYKKFKKS